MGLKIDSHSLYQHQSLRHSFIATLPLLIVSSSSLECQNATFTCGMERDQALVRVLYYRYIPYQTNHTTSGLEVQILKHTIFPPY
jgi:hypothetical protein